MGAAILQLRADLQARFDVPPGIRDHPDAQPLSTGVPAIDALTAGGIPRIPTPTDTAKTSSPSDIATRTTLKNAATLTLGNAGSDQCDSVPLFFTSASGALEVTLIESGCPTTLMVVDDGGAAGGAAVGAPAGLLAAIFASSAAVSGRYFEANAVTVERSCVNVNGLLRK